MLRYFLQAKIHPAYVTHANLEYEGSCAIDKDILTATGIQPYEQLQIYNISNGERLVTYAIEAPAGSKTISMNGAAAHKAAPGDRIIICAYTGLHELEAEHHQPTIIMLDAHNTIRQTKHTETNTPALA